MSTGSIYETCSAQVGNATDMQGMLQCIADSAEAVSSL
jgi:hypothetical protein